jgi:tight adherence protein C
MVLLLIIGLALTGGAVALVARAIALPRIRAAERLEQIGAYGAPPPVGEVGGGLSAYLDRLAGSLGARVSPTLDGGEEQELRTLLMSAGMYGTGPGLFLGYRVLIMVGLAVMWLWLATLLGVSVAVLFAGIPLTALAGWSFPVAFVRDRAKRRLIRIDYELPELIDSLVVTVEAGAGFAGALTLAAREIGGPLGDEIKLALREQNMGLSTEAALEHMLTRADTPAMRSFVRSVLQSENLGVSIGEIMRSLATEMRSRRRAAAEERAHKAPIKILFPLVFLIFPAVFIVLLYPAIYNLSHAFGGG